MKKSLNFAIITLVAVITLAIFVQTVPAADMLLDTQIKTATVAIDKNGNEYVRFIIVENKNLNGIAYKADVVVMCFGSIVDQAKQLSDGDPLKAIASTNEYKGRTNYNILAFVE